MKNVLTSPLATPLLCNTKFLLILFKIFNVYFWLFNLSTLLLETLQKMMFGCQFCHTHQIHIWTQKIRIPI